MKTTPKAREDPIWVQLDTHQPPPEVRVVVEEGAYLVADFLYRGLSEASVWVRWKLGRMRMDLTPQGNPVLVELRQPIETWQIQRDMILPKPIMSGTMYFTKGKGTSVSPIVKTDHLRTMVEIRFAFHELSVVAQVGSRVLVETTRLNSEGEKLSGQLLAIWIADLVALPSSVGILRALGLTRSTIAKSKQPKNKRSLISRRDTT